MKKDNIPHLGEQLAYLSTVRDEDIDFSDIPEITDWSGAIKGIRQHPAKKTIPLNIDADVIDWFSKKYSAYQVKINNILKEYIQAQSVK